MPFGFSLASWRLRRGDSPTRAIFITLGAGFLVTVFVESMQNLLPHRTPNMSDILSNTLGALAGAACVWVWDRKGMLWSSARVLLTPGKVAALASIHLVWILLCSWTLMRGFLPGGWESTYTLTVGNETGQVAPWRGTIRDLILLDRAIDDAEAAELLEGRVPSSLRNAVIADYPLSRGIELADRRQILSAFVPQSAEQASFSTSGVVLGPTSWLATEKAVAPLANRVNVSGQFTVAMTVATLDLTQPGPARIVTVSLDDGRRNLMLGQDWTHLAVRWRSPITGRNGTSPELQFPGVFRSLEPQRLVVTSDGVSTSVHSGSSPTAFRILLRPETGLKALLFETGYWQVTRGRFDYWGSAVLFAMLTFLPQGMLAGISLRRTKWSGAKITIASMSLAIPVLLQQSFVAAYQPGSLSWPLIGLSGTAAFLGFAIIQLWEWHDRRSARVPATPFVVSRLV